MKKTVPRKLQLQRLTIRLLEGRLARVATAGPVPGTTNYSMREDCSTSCMCSEPCTDTCRPCAM